MATILGMKRRFEKLDTGRIIVETLSENAQSLNEVNLEQMYDGKTNQGTDIRPSYFEDPFFKTYEQAAAYSEWKDRITPNYRRNSGTPNLYINGFYYRSRVVVVTGDSIFHRSAWSEGKEIEEKYDNIDGLGGKYKRLFLEKYVLPVLKDKLYQATGLQIKS